MSRDCKSEDHRKPAGKKVPVSYTDTNYHDANVSSRTACDTQPLTWDNAGMCKITETQVHRARQNIMKRKQIIRPLMHPKFWACPGAKALSTVYKLRLFQHCSRVSPRSFACDLRPWKSSSASETATPAVSTSCKMQDSEIRFAANHLELGRLG